MTKKIKSKKKEKQRQREREREMDGGGEEARAVERNEKTREKQ